jgi:2-dehydro-3-deoxyphosphogluconate aldolase/(4S)-4-hydroxy-2-oxoglutarate aldolase
MNIGEIAERIRQAGVVPVISIEEPKAAVPLADALLEGGLGVAEITFRTPSAARAIELIARDRPELLVGAGTILSRENLMRAQAAGARFAFAPGLNPPIVNAANECGIPFVPGVATPSDVEHALSMGCSTLKLFPAEVMGGIAMLNALAGPYQHTGVRFVPTGGVSPDNLESYLNHTMVVAVGGTWIARKEDLAAGNWEGIQGRCLAAREVVRRVRCDGR